MDAKKLDDSDPLLGSSKLLDAVRKTVGFAQENDGIGLTKGKAFNRKFATWAAENFNWPEYSADRLLRIQKVLNEEDVIPVLVLHELMISMKLGRHVKGKWQFSKKAEVLVQTPDVPQTALTKGFLFEFDHCRLQRFPFVAPGNWDVWLNVINVEAHGGISEAALLKTFYGVEYSGAGVNVRLDCPIPCSFPGQGYFTPVSGNRDEVQFAAASLALVSSIAHRRDTAQLPH